MMYLDRRQRYLSRSLGVYVQADTGNPNGWRPQYKALGEMPALPNWKTAHAMRSQAQRGQQILQHGLQRIHEFKSHQVDAHARGERMHSRVSYMGNFGLLDPATAMVPGAVYVFHFRFSGNGLDQEATDVANMISGDANFRNPVGTNEPGGLQLQFTYNGRGSSIQGAGAEIQNIVNASGKAIIGKKILFASADGGPAPVPGASSGPGGKTVFATSPDGTVIQWSDGSVTDTSTGVTIDASGNVVSTGGTPPAGAAPQQQQFSFSNFFAGLGSGGALALGAVGLVLLLRN